MPRNAASGINMASPVGESEAGSSTLHRLRSGRSQIHSFVRFVNLTLRKVDIVWLNYEGARVRYKTLHPGQFVDVNTFVGHPWIFRDADTGDRLMVQLKEVYEPIGYNIAQGWPPQRRIVNITIPVYTLQERCLQVLRDIVPANMINRLDLPSALKQEMMEYSAIKTRHYSSCT